MCMKCTSESIVQGRLYTKSLCVCVCVKSISAFDLSGQRRPRFLIVIGGVLLRDTQRERTGWLVGEKKGGRVFSRGGRLWRARYQRRVHRRDGRIRAIKSCEVRTENPRPCLRRAVFLRLVFSFRAVPSFLCDRENNSQ